MARAEAVRFEAAPKARQRREGLRRSGIERSHDPLAADYDSAWTLLARVSRECLRPHWKLVAVVGVVMVAGAATGGLIPLLMQKAADGIFVRKDPSLIFVVPALFLLVTVLRAAIDWVSTVFEAQLSAKIVADLRVRMFDTVAAADLAWIQQVHSGRFVSVFLGDSGTVDRSAARVLIGLTRNLLSVTVLMGAMFYLDWRLSIVVLFGAPIAVVNLGRQRKRIRAAVRQSMKHSGDLGSMLTQTLQSMRVVKAYGQEHSESRRFRRLIRNLRKYAMQATRSRASVSPVSDVVAGAGTAAAILYGGWQGIYGDLTLGHFAGFLAAASLALAPLKSLASTQATLSEGLLAAARVFALIDHASHVVEKRDATALHVTGGAISFRDVTFGYEPGKPVLQDFTLEVAPGQKVALVGPSGAGKSTVLNLILRFYDPASGTVCIDAQDLRDVTLMSVRSASALLTQEPVLFDDTIGGNISYGSEDADQEALIAAAESAAAHDFIMRLPQGYRTRVGETGNRLSGGERQRIAFARAMLRNTPILLLDEPTSALDAESEMKVQGAMERLLAGRTVVMIAHRLSTVKRADLICLMEGGRIIESGTHAQLVALRGRYARMVEAQFLGPDGAISAAAG